MVFTFNSLNILKKHHNFLEKKLGTSNFFLIGGCVRDVILGLNKNPDDIDVTMGGEPQGIYNGICKEDFSHFITEKFGTITLIPKEKIGMLKYEITPLRAESSYSDFRHPGEIFWSNNLLLDFQRRDFTINSIYYSVKRVKTPFYGENLFVSEDKMLKILQKEGFIYLKNIDTLIIQDKQLISQIFPNALCDIDFLYYLLDIQKIGYCFGNKKDHSKKYSSIHIILDPALGIHDMYNKRLQTVGDPDVRFHEDALRLLRALRFVNVINNQLKEIDKKKGKSPLKKLKLFDFGVETWKSIKNNHNLLANIAKERIKEELVKCFQKGDPFSFVGLMDEAGMIPILFPSLWLTKHVDQPIRYHPFDIYTHILLALYYLQQINTNYLVRFAMLYHDVGKVGQYAKYGENLSKEQIRELLAGPLNHRFSSAELAKHDFKILGFSNKEIEEIQWYIKEHHTPGEILQSHPQNREKKVRKLLVENGFERVNNLFDINIADRLGMYNPLQNASDLSDSWYLKTILQKIKVEGGQFTSKDLVVNGNDIMEHFNLKPGKLVGDLLSIALDWVLGDIKGRNNQKLIFANLANHLKNMGLL